MELHELAGHRQVAANVSSAATQLTALSNEIAQVHGATSLPVKRVNAAVMELRKAEIEMAKLLLAPIADYDEPEDV